MLAYTGAASRGFIFLEEVIRSVSPAVLWILGITFGLVIVLSLCSERWWPPLAVRLTGAKSTMFDRIYSPYSGGLILWLSYFFLFPLSALFSDNSNAWWIFLLFGWGMDFVILYYVIVVKRFSADQQKKFKEKKRESVIKDPLNGLRIVK